MIAIVVGLVAASTVDSADPLATDTQVVALGVEFDVAEITVPAGENGFWIDNQDGIRHAFTVRGTDLQIDVPAFSSQRAGLDLASGSYTVFCAVPGHENMVIELTVEGQA